MKIKEAKLERVRTLKKRINTLENELNTVYKEQLEVLKANSIMINKLQKLEESNKKLSEKIKELKAKEREEWDIFLFYFILLTLLLSKKILKYNQKGGMKNVRFQTKQGRIKKSVRWKN